MHLWAKTWRGTGLRLTKTGGTFDDIEPISRFHEAFQGDVDVAYAAAVVGLETEAFLDKIT